MKHWTGGAEHSRNPVSIVKLIEILHYVDRDEQVWWPWCFDLFNVYIEIPTITIEQDYSFSVSII